MGYQQSKGKIDEVNKDKNTEHFKTTREESNKSMPSTGFGATTLDYAEEKSCRTEVLPEDKSTNMSEATETSNLIKPISSLEAMRRAISHPEVEHQEAIKEKEENSTFNGLRIGLEAIKQTVDYSVDDTNKAENGEKKTDANHPEMKRATYKSKPTIGLESMKRAVNYSDDVSSKNYDFIEDRNTEDYDSPREEHKKRMPETDFETREQAMDRFEAETSATNKVEGEPNLEPFKSVTAKPIVLTPEKDVEEKRRSLNQKKAQSYISDIWMENRKNYQHLGDQNPFFNSPPDPQTVMELYGPSQREKNKQTDNSARDIPKLDKEYIQRHMFQNFHTNKNRSKYFKWPRSSVPQQDKGDQLKGDQLKGDQLKGDQLKGDGSPSELRTHVSGSSRKEIISPEYSRHEASRQFYDTPLENVKHTINNNGDKILSLYRKPLNNYHNIKSVPMTDTNPYSDIPLHPSNENNRAFSHHQEEIIPQVLSPPYTKPPLSKHGPTNKEKQKHEQTPFNDHNYNNIDYKNDNLGGGKKVTHGNKMKLGEGRLDQIPDNFSVIQYGPIKNHPPSPQYTDSTSRQVKDLYALRRGPGEYKRNPYRRMEASDGYDTRQHSSPAPARYPQTPEFPSIPYEQYKPPIRFPDPSLSYQRKPGDYYDPPSDRQIYNIGANGYNPPYTPPGQVYESISRPYYKTEEYPGNPNLAKYPMVGPNDPYLSYHPNVYGSDQYHPTMQPPEVNQRYYFPPPPQHYPYYSWYSNPYTPDPFWQVRNYPPQYSPYQYENPGLPPPAGGNNADKPFQQLERLRAEQVMKYMQYPPRDWYARPYTNNHEEQKNTPPRPFYQTGTSPFINSPVP